MVARAFMDLENRLGCWGELCSKKVCLTLSLNLLVRMDSE